MKADLLSSRQLEYDVSYTETVTGGTLHRQMKSQQPLLTLQL